MMLICDDVILIIPDRYPSLYGLWRNNTEKSRQMFGILSIPNVSGRPVWLSRVMEFWFYVIHSLPLRLAQSQASEEALN